MSELEKNVTPRHELAELFSRRVDIIYEQLREYEESLNNQSFEDTGDSQVKIMDLLENLDTIKEAAQFIRPHNLDLRCRQKGLEEQIKCLEQSVDLLKLECGEGVKK